MPASTHRITHLNQDEVTLNLFAGINAVGQSIRDIYSETDPAYLCGSRINQCVIDLIRATTPDTFNQHLLQVDAAIEACCSQFKATKEHYFLEHLGALSNALSKWDETYKPEYIRIIINMPATEFRRFITRCKEKSVSYTRQHPLQSPRHAATTAPTLFTQTHNSSQTEPNISEASKAYIS